MYLYDKKFKCVIRSYGLIYNNNNYIYNDSKFNIYKNEYSKTNLSNTIHNDTYNSIAYKHLIDMPFYNDVFIHIQEICKKLNIFFQNFNSHNKFIILGYDFILDTDLNPYLIEVNAYPDIGIFKSNLMNDFAELVIFEDYTNNNGFIKLL